MNFLWWMTFALSSIDIGVNMVDVASARDRCIASSVIRCQCRPLPTPIDAAERSRVVVRGTVVAFADSTMYFGSHKATLRVARIRVVANWKQTAVDSLVSVATGFDSGDCGYPFEVGREYLVYASPEGQLTVPSTSSCHRTRPFDKATDDFLALGTPSGPIGR